MKFHEKFYDSETQTMTYPEFMHGGAFINELQNYSYDRLLYTIKYVEIVHKDNNIVLDLENFIKIYLLPCVIKYTDRMIERVEISRQTDNEKAFRLVATFTGKTNFFTKSLNPDDAAETDLLEIQIDGNDISIVITDISPVENDDWDVRQYSQSLNRTIFARYFYNTELAANDLFDILPWHLQATLDELKNLFETPKSLGIGRIF